jgi:MoxR-like ATPase
MTFSQERLALAADRFAAFFNELSEHFVERSDVLAQIALALISREHVLMTGPPGTAKSRLARAVLGRIVDGKTGKPSVFSRQFTESTVQTDLIGPINFKTLMETGRTEHFADEGMLGSVHAFLDEVFDGRDMLLRSTLNVLQERELKQGATTTKGQIECAIMTTNRYLAEVLESSRETLLAFVDRIAFIAYVPKAFATSDALAKILEDQIAGNGAKPLRAQLTIQDIDVLQSAAENVLVDRTTCEQLAAFLASFEDEIAQVMRADPTFVPTRYLSTRTAVRLGGILKAAAVYDFALGARKRSLCILPGDFRFLRLALLLTGPTYETLAALSTRETNPRERQQLKLMRLERDVFERCLLKVPDWSVDISKTVVEAELVQSSDLATLFQQPTRVLVRNATRLSELVSAGDTIIEDADQRLQQTLLELIRRTASVGFGVGFSDQRLFVTVDEIANITTKLAELSIDGAQTRAWLYGAALQILEYEVKYAASYYVELSARVNENATFDKTVTFCTATIDRLRELMNKRDKLINLSASGSKCSDTAWSRLRSELMTTLVFAWNAYTTEWLGAELNIGKIESLRTLLEGLGQVITQVRIHDEQLSHLEFPPYELEQRVIQPCLMPYLEVMLTKLDGAQRNEVSTYVEKTLVELQRMGLRQAIDSKRWLSAIAESLLRGHGTAVDFARYPKDRAGYRALRNSMPRTTLCFVLVDTAMRLCTLTGKLADQPRERIRELLQGVDISVRRQLVEQDILHINYVIAFLSAWWKELTSKVVDGNLIESPEYYAFLAVVHDESALSRYSFEASLTQEVESAPCAENCLGQIEALRGQIHDDLSRIFTRDQNRKWTKLLASEQR